MKISDLQPDKRNARRRTARGHDAIETSLRKLGAGRSIVIDKHGQVISGNGVIESAGKAGITEIEVVQSDGSRIIAVQRVDLDLDTDAKARQLAIADNRTAELAEWNPDILRSLSEEIDLQPFFNTGELQELGVAETATTGIGDAPPEGRYKEQYGVIVVCKSEADQRAVYEKLIGQGLECRVVVT